MLQETESPSFSAGQFFPSVSSLQACMVTAASFLQVFIALTGLSALQLVTAAALRARFAASAALASLDDLLGLVVPVDLRPDRD